MLYSEMVATKSVLYGDRKKFLVLALKKTFSFTSWGFRQKELAEVAKID